MRRNRGKSIRNYPRDPQNAIQIRPGGQGKQPKEQHNHQETGVTRTFRIRNPLGTGLGPWRPPRSHFKRFLRNLGPLWGPQFFQKIVEELPSRRPKRASKAENTEKTGFRNGSRFGSHFGPIFEGIFKEKIGFLEGDKRL